MKTRKKKEEEEKKENKENKKNKKERIGKKYVTLAFALISGIIISSSIARDFTLTLNFGERSWYIYMCKVPTYVCVYVDYLSRLHLDFLRFCYDKINEGNFIVS